MTQNLIITTIKPTASLFASFKPRTKEGMPERAECYAAYELPAMLKELPSSISQFATQAYQFAVGELLKQAVREGKAEFSVPTLSELFAPTTREFLITAKELNPWTTEFALPIISAAIAAKAGLSADSVKVVKKALAYKDLLASLASRSLLSQSEIDSCIKVLELLAASGKQNPYTDNVAQAIERKQAKLNEKLAGLAELEDEIDF